MRSARKRGVEVGETIIMSKAKVAEAVSLSESTVEELVRRGEFPRPRVLSGKRVGWLVDEVVAWAKARPVSDQAPPPNTAGRRGRKFTRPALPASATAA